MSAYCGFEFEFSTEDQISESQHQLYQWTTQVITLSFGNPTLQCGIVYIMQASAILKLTGLFMNENVMTLNFKWVLRRIIIDAVNKVWSKIRNLWADKVCRYL